MHTLLRKQYEFVKESREVLLEYCAGIRNEDFNAQNSSFGRGSIRNLLAHIANTYKFWIGKWGLSKNMTFAVYDQPMTLDEVKSLFTEVNELVLEFLANLDSQKIKEVEFELQGKTAKADPVRIFTHVITHEFHHKGQILSLSRHLGYIPVDTDIMR